MNEISELTTTNTENNAHKEKLSNRLIQRIRRIFEPKVIEKHPAGNNTFSRRKFLQGSAIFAGAVAVDSLLAPTRAFAASKSDESKNAISEVIETNTLHKAELTDQDKAEIDELVSELGGRERLLEIVDRPIVDYANPYGEAPEPVIKDSVRNYLAAGGKKTSILVQDFPKEFFITNSFENRSADNYAQVLGQFGIEKPDSIFSPEDNLTYCNLWVRQAFRMLGWEFNWFGETQNGTLERPYGILANDIYDQLDSKTGIGLGMIKITGELAVKLANLGIPVAGSVKNFQGHPGHIWMVMPTAQGEVFHAANVGRENYFNEPFRYDEYTSDFGYGEIIYACTEKDFAQFVLNKYNENLGKLANQENNSENIISLPAY